MLRWIAISCSLYNRFRGLLTSSSEHPRNLWQAKVSDMLEWLSAAALGIAICFNMMQQHSYSPDAWKMDDRSVAVLILICS
ncbi:hypothetical protein VNO77_37076 [Canavalia gladiata]|uniref:Uncharacterized protein n=1 Tax=Canavalia gladiata TaxID=3824 RepID=A0AAN9PWJ4_CANGL